MRRKSPVAVGKELLFLIVYPLPARFLSGLTGAALNRRLERAVRVFDFKDFGFTGSNRLARLKDSRKFKDKFVGSFGNGHRLAYPAPVGRIAGCGFQARRILPGDALTLSAPLDHDRREPVLGVRTKFLGNLINRTGYNALNGADCL